MINRLIVDDDYNWVDTQTGSAIEPEDAFDLVNELWEEYISSIKINQELLKTNKELQTRLENCKKETKNF